MKVTVQENEKIYELNFSDITQLCGINFVLKNYVIESLCKHFSHEKYLEYEEKMVENVKINGEILGRNYYDIIRIKGRSDLLNQIKITKTSFFAKYLAKELENFDCQIEVAQVVSYINSLFDNVNEHFYNQGVQIQLEYSEVALLDMIQKCELTFENNKKLGEMSNYTLLQQFLMLIKNYNEKMPASRIVIIENIDHLVSYDKFEDIYKDMMGIAKQSNIKFVLSSSIEGYVMVEDENIEGINIINDQVFVMPDLEHMMEYIHSNYPMGRIFSKEGILQKLRAVAQNIGRENYSFSLQRDIILKMLNGTICVDIDSCGTYSVPELAFLFREDVV